MTSTKTMEIKVERTIPAPCAEVFDAWLNPKIPGTPWHAADKFFLNPKVDGLFYWHMTGNAHYGRFTKLERPGCIEHTWMSPSTAGLESTVIVTFKQHGENTQMTLVHSGLPDTDRGRSHEKGWNFFLGNFADRYQNSARKTK